MFGERSIERKDETEKILRSSSVVKLRNERHSKSRRGVMNRSGKAGKREVHKSVSRDTIDWRISKRMPEQSDHRHKSRVRSRNKSKRPKSLSFNDDIKKGDKDDWRRNSISTTLTETISISKWNRYSSRNGKTSYKCNFIFIFQSVL
jgi:hypothetical protein